MAPGFTDLAYITFMLPFNGFILILGEERLPVSRQISRRIENAC